MGGEGARGGAVGSGRGSRGEDALYMRVVTSGEVHALLATRGALFALSCCGDPVPSYCCG